MYVGQDFPDTTPNEDRLLAYDFQDAFSPTDSISSAAWTCAVATTSTVQDAGAAGRIGAPFSNNALIAAATLQHTVAGAKYVITCIATSLSGQKAEFQSYIKSVEVA